MWLASVGVTGSLAVSLLVSSSSSSGMGLRKSTGRDSGEEDRLVGLLDDAEDVCRGAARDFNVSSCCSIEAERPSWVGSGGIAGEAMVMAGNRTASDKNKRNSLKTRSTTMPT